MKRITIIGLAALCALALTAAVDTAGATAAETTAWTCVSGGTGGLGHKFLDQDCWVENNTSGTFGHLEIPANTSTTLSLKKIINPVLKTIIAGASVTIEATGIACVAASPCVAHNQGAAGSMEVFGEGGKIEFTGVTVPSSPTKCEVVGGSITTNELTIQTSATNEAAINPIPTEKPALASFRIASKTGQVCAVAGPVTLKGNVNGVFEGAFLTVNVSTASKTLTVGVNGASLTAEVTMEASNGFTTHPVALT